MSSDFNAQKEQKVGLGSIGHILKVTFKDFYPTPAPSNENGIDEEGERLKVEEEEAIKTEGITISNNNEQSTENTTSQLEDIQTEVLPSTTVESLSPQTDSEENNVTPPNVIINQITVRRQIQIRPDRMGCDDIESIDNELEVKLRHAASVEAYLREAIQNSLIADVEEAKNMKNKGLLVKSQIPVGASKLAIDSSQLQSFGKFGSHLLQASDLVSKSQLDILKASGNWITEEKSEFLNETAAEPNYLKMTSSLKVRKENIAKENELRSSMNEGIIIPSYSPEESIRLSKLAKEKRKEVSATLNNDTKDANEKVLQRMKTKLDFLTNPRYEDLAKADTRNNQKILNDKSLSLIVTTDTYEEDGVRSFIPQPSIAEFKDYEVGKVYTSTLLFRNVSSVSRKLRVLPPDSKYFCISLIKFPGEDGVIAPGMACQINIQFSPDSLSDYDDYIVAISDLNRFQVPIKANRIPPELSIPQVLNAGCCLVGNKAETKIRCKNSGGPGRFRMLPPSAWPHPSTSVYEFENIDIPPFLISPAEFELKTGESIDLLVKYNPTNEGKHTREFIMVCDNCQVKRFTIEGISCKVSLQICQLDNVIVNFNNPIAAPPESILFPSKIPGTTISRSFQVENFTPLAFNYRWENSLGLYENDKSNKKKAFTIKPIHGRIGASGKMEFSITFHPYDSIEYTDDLKLIVEKIPRESAPFPNLLPKIKEKKKNNKKGAKGAITDEGNKFEVALVDAPVINCQLVGGGKSLDVALFPPVTRFPGVLFPDKTYSCSFTLRNDEDLEAEFNWTNYFNHFTKNEKGEDGEDDKNNQECKIDISPKSGKIMPRSSINVKIDLTPTQVGNYDLIVPCMIKHGSKGGLPVRLVAKVVGPSVYIDTPEVDFGLVKVSQKVECTLPFTNVSSIPARWQFSQNGASLIDWKLLDNMNNDESIASVPTSALPSPTKKTSGATFYFEPQFGILPPYSSDSVKLVCTAGHLPERVRATVMCSVQHGESKYTLVRAEVQSPRVNLNTSSITLGTTYVSVPSVQTVVMRNISNLPAAFTWEEPSGPSEFFDVFFSPSTGEIQEKEEVTITVTIMPKKPGRIEALFACKVEGMINPIGFSISTLIRALVISYTLIDENDTTTEHEKMLVSPSENPATKLPTVDFGNDMVIFTRKNIRLLIKNHSGIPTSFNLFVKKFPAALNIDDQRSSINTNSILPSNSDNNSNTNTWQNSTTDLLNNSIAPSSTLTSNKNNNGVNNNIATSPINSEGRKGRKNSITVNSGSNFLSASASATMQQKDRRILDSAHEKTNKFFSKNGLGYTSEKIHRNEDKGILREGNGVAFVIEPCKGELLPWEQRVVQVTCFADLPGRYRDALTCEVVGLPAATMTVRVDVKGSPLSLYESVVGLNMFSNPISLNWMDNLDKAAAVKKTIKVVNESPVDTILSWRLQNTKYKEPPPINFSIVIAADPRGDNKVDCVFARPDPPPLPPFLLDPSEGIVPARGSAKFNVTFDSVEEVGEWGGMMCADVVFLPNNNRNILNEIENDTKSTTLSRKNSNQSIKSAKSVLSSKSNATATTALSTETEGNNLIPPPITDCLKVELKASTISPILHVDKRLDAYERHSLLFNIWSTHSTDHSSYFKDVTLTNKMNSNVTFRLEASPPFILYNVDCSAPPHPLAKKIFNKDKKNSSTSGLDYEPLFTLPQNNNVKIRIRYKTNKRTESTNNSSIIQLKNEAHGLLTISYSNGKKQEIDLHAQVIPPMLCVSPAEHNFGTIHVDKQVSIPVYIANPTIVDAKWKLVHVPALQLSKSVYVDDGSVFVFDENEGSLQGPTYQLNTAGVHNPVIGGLEDSETSKVKKLKELTVKFKATKNVIYRSRYRLCVEGGESFDILLTGQGTYEEKLEKE